VILATQEAENRRISVRSQPGQMVHETLSQKTLQKRAPGVAQGIGPEFKPQYHKNKTKQTKKKYTGEAKAFARCRQKVVF
jgi:hypothetical protein